MTLPRHAQILLDPAPRLTLGPDRVSGGRSNGITYPEPSDDVVSSLHGSTSGDYPNIDRFTRPTSSVWTKQVSGGDLDFYDVDVSWDLAGQVTLVEDNVHAGYDVSYTLDDLSRVILAEEGTWNGSAITSRTRQQVWELDQLGNWDRDKLDLDGDGLFTGTGEFNVAGTFNDANEQTARGSDTLVYDAVGNLTDNGNDQEYVYDVFGRLVEVNDQSSNLIARYRYNGAHQRIGFQYDTDGDGTVETSGGDSNDDPWYYLVNDHNWRVVATVLAVDDGAGVEAGETGAEADDDAKEVFVYHQAGMDAMGQSSSYLDLMILRDRDASTAWASASDGNLEERTYVCQNWRADVVALLDDTGARVEGARYSSYGVPFGIPRADVNADGTVDSSDASAVSAASGKSVGQTGYEVRLDIDLDGDVDAADSAIVTSDTGNTLGRGALSSDPTTSGGVGFRAGYAGYRWDDAAVKWHVRRRVLDPESGRWMKRDDAGYVDGGSLFEYVQSRPVILVDLSGTSGCQNWWRPGCFLWCVTCGPTAEIVPEDPGHDSPGGGGEPEPGECGTVCGKQEVISCNPADPSEAQWTCLGACTLANTRCAKKEACRQLNRNPIFPDRPIVEEPPYIHPPHDDPTREEFDRQCRSDSICTCRLHSVKYDTQIFEVQWGWTGACHGCSCTISAKPTGWDGEPWSDFEPWSVMITYVREEGKCLL
jgi:RHS repeat-associated protein